MSLSLCKLDSQVDSQLRTSMSIRHHRRIIVMDNTIDVTRLGQPVTLTLTEHFYDRLDVRADGIVNNIRNLRELTTRHDKFGAGDKDTKADYVAILKSIQKKLNDEISFVSKNYGKADSAVKVNTAKGKVKAKYVKPSRKDMLKKFK